MEKKVAKLFIHNNKQAVLLPAEYRFEGKEVFIHKDPETDNIILARKHETWASFFAELEKIPAEIPADFLTHEDRQQGFHDRDPFAGWRDDETLYA
jgi:antitoxin VapB